MSEIYWIDRGRPWEYDPGPPRNRSWPRLFAETPNYRGLGKAITGGEAFRWHFGPMFYRGRLGDNQVKVLIVGQEGAQDESLTHRSFTGGTGARMQHVLRHLGITRSYLFLNTFVYPIFGQYHDKLRLLAQNPASPICRHRNELFDYVVSRNDLQLAIAVGNAAKESLATWVQSHGGTADPRALHQADAHAVAPRLRMVGVPHPGGAGKGASVKDLERDFAEALRHFEHWVGEDPGWMTPDPDGHRQAAADYEYKSAPIPFGDFPYGTAWRLGRGATSSNRRDGQSAIQMFSANGTYNNAGHTLSYSGSTSGSKDGYVEAPGDLAYEPPRIVYTEFDRGPSPRFARLLLGGQPGLPWPDFTALGLGHPSFGYGALYRGRLDSPSILVLADQGCHDDLFTGRALSGNDGQHLQALLRAAGVTTGYGILRALPVDTLGATPSRVGAAIDDPQTRALHAEVLHRARPDVVLTMGPHSTRLMSHLDTGNTPVVDMLVYGRRGWKTSWQHALANLSPLSYRRDLASPSFAYDGEREQIPRIDLPFGTLRWQASSGDRALRAHRSGAPSTDYYKLAMPGWAVQLAPSPLTPTEQQAVDALVAGGGS